MEYTEEEVFINSVKNVSICGYLCTPIEGKKFGFVLFHGGQAGRKKVFKVLQLALASEGISSLAIDFRGRGKSSGVYEKSTLADRLVDAKSSVDYFIKKTQLFQFGIVGISLSGDLVRLVREYSNLKTIILISPVAVPEDLTNVSPPHLANIIGKKTGSWKNSPIFPLLNQFSGQKLVIYGEKEDAAVPEMVESFKKAVEPRGKWIVLKNAGHNTLLVNKLASVEAQNTQQIARRKTIEMIIEFVKSNID